MAISVNQNGHFEEMAAWLQILQIVGNSTVFYLSFDTHDSPGSVFVWKSKSAIGFGNVGKNRVKCPCVYTCFVKWPSRDDDSRQVIKSPTSKLEK